MNDDDINDEANKPAPAARDRDAEHLMKMLDLQLTQRRGALRDAGDGRTSFRVWSLALIIGGAIAALCALEWMASQLQRSGGAHGGSPAPVVSATPAGAR